MCDESFKVRHYDKMLSVKQIVHVFLAKYFISYQSLRASSYSCLNNSCLFGLRFNITGNIFSVMLGQPVCNSFDKDNIYPINFSTVLFLNCTFSTSGKHVCELYTPVSPTFI